MATRRDPGLKRYLLDGERVVVALHQHWGKIAAPVAAAVAGLVMALWVDASVPSAYSLVSQLTWLLWIALVIWTSWQVLEWRHDLFVATDKRLLLTYGLISRRVAMMPLMKVTDMSYRRSIPGRLLGYGEFIMESAGQDQALHDIKWVPDPDRTYRAICAEIFGVEDHDRVLVPVDEDDGSAGFRDPAWSDPGWSDPGWSDPSRSDPSRSDPAAALPSAVEEYGSNSRAIPVQRRGEDGESLYQSEDLRRRNRAADTGPIPVYDPRADPRTDD